MVGRDVLSLDAQAQMAAQIRDLARRMAEEHAAHMGAIAGVFTDPTAKCPVCGAAARATTIHQERWPGVDEPLRPPPVFPGYICLQQHLAYWTPDGPVLRRPFQPVGHV